jgi:uncharacterized protein (DUF1778 family)
MWHSRESPSPSPLESDLRDARLHIRLTEDEKRIFTDAAYREHLSISAWIRLASLYAARSRDRKMSGTKLGRNSPGSREAPIHIRLTEDEKRMFSAAAERHQLSISAWIRLAGFRAAKSRRSVGYLWSLTTLFGG